MKSVHQKGGYFVMDPNTESDQVYTLTNEPEFQFNLTPVNQPKG